MTSHRRLVAAALVMGTAFALTLPAGTATAATPAPASGVRGTLQHLSALGTGNVWAAGEVHTRAGKHQHLMYHRGSSWTRVTGLPRFVRSNALYDVDAVSTHDVWALAEAGRRPYALQWNGTGWTKTALPFTDQQPTYRGIDALGPDDVWAVGSRVVRDPSTGTRYSRPLAAHFDGTSWQPVEVPALTDSGLTSISMSAADDGWATLTNVDTRGYRFQMLHWDGSTWSLVDGPVGSVGSEQHVTSVVDISPTDAWAGTDTAHALHWDGTSWSEVPFGLGPDGYVDEVTATGPDDVWAAGTNCTHQCHPAFEHWDGNSWTVRPAPTGDKLYGATAISADAPDDAWALADFATRANIRHTAFLHWDGTSWTVA